MVAPPSTTLIELSLEDHVATITLNRPDQLNAFNEQMAAEVVSAWVWIREDDDVHCVVVLRSALVVVSLRKDFIGPLMGSFFRQICLVFCGGSADP